MTTICGNCGEKVSEYEPLTIVGRANVEGENSLVNFRDVGVIWYAKDSWEECWVCPFCGHHNKI